MNIVAISIVLVVVCHSLAYPIKPTLNATNYTFVKTTTFVNNVVDPITLNETHTTTIASNVINTTESITKTTSKSIFKEIFGKIETKPNINITFIGGNYFV